MTPDCYASPNERAIGCKEEAESTLVVHVREGKPLTEHGAKLLGVPWP